MISLNRHLFVLAILAVCVVLVLPAGASPQLNKNPNIVLISWDGISRDTLQDLLDSGQLTTLPALLEKGDFINISITDHYPDTMAGHAEILTGYPPDITGVFKSMRYEEIPAGLTVFERLEDALGADAIRTAIIASQERSVGSLPGLPFFNAGKVVDYYYDQNSDAGLVGSVASEAVYQFAGVGRFLIFAHFRDAADAGYAYGAGSPEQNRAIMTIDEGTGMILKAVEDAGVLDNTVIYITTDHGFNTGPKDLTGQTNLWMVTSEPGYTLTGDQKDISPTIMTRMGVSFENLTPGYTGRSLI